MGKSKFYQIKNITEHEYTLVGCDGSIITLPIQEVDKTASAFTIQDAKDGDVLVSSSGKPFIFKGFFDNDPMAYGGLVADDSFWSASNSNWTTVYCKPATKEQCDLLFQKMKEVGYEWDSEKKELKKIETNPTWCEEDEEMIKGLNNCLSELEEKCGWRYTYVNNKDVELDKIRNWLKCLRERIIDVI